MKIIKLFKSEITHHYKSFSYIILTLVISLVGITLVESFKDSFSTHLENKSKDILGSDLKISGRKKLTPEIKKKLNEFFKDSAAISQISTFSMGRAKNFTRLVLVNEQKKGFPFYGNILLKNSKNIKDISLSSQEIVVYPEILEQFGLEIGEFISVGSGRFKIIDVVVEDSGQVFEMGAIAPKVFLSIEGMNEAKLIQQGSTAFYSNHYQLKTPGTIELKNKLNELINDNTYRVSLPKDSSDQVGRVTNYLTDFLGLVSLSSFILSLVGVFYLFRSYISKERKTFGILKTLGITSEEILITQIFLMVVFSLFSVFLSFSLSFFLGKVLSPLISLVLGFDFSISVSLSSAFISFVISLFGVLFICFPLLMNELKNSAAGLLMPEIKSKIKAVAYFPLMAGVLFLCVFFSHSYIIGSIFFIVIFGASFLIFLGGGKLLKLSEKYLALKNTYQRMTVRYLTRYRLKTLSIFLSIFLSSLLITFIPGLRESILSEIDLEKTNKPNYFMFDIQEEQHLKLKDFLEYKKIQTLGSSPMVRGRLLKINDALVKSEAKDSFSREEQREQRFRNRGINLSFRKELDQSETIKSGEKMPMTWDGVGIPPVSLEHRYAKRIGAQIGDVLTFDILGIEQKGKVVNLRKVRWSSFLPNFFILFPDGVINDAPKTYLYAIKSNDKDSINEVSAQLPNVSIVDLKRVIDKVSSILKQMAIALASMSLLVLIVGVVVLINLVSQHLYQRSKDLFLFRLVGVENHHVKKMIKNEFVFLSIVASFLGSLIGAISSGLFGVFFFQSEFVLSYSNIFIVVGGISFICLLMTDLIIKNFFRKNEELISAF